jgi:hypothetical protein
MELFTTYPMKKSGRSPSIAQDAGQGFTEISGEQLPTTDLALSTVQKMRGHYIHSQILTTGSYSP